MSRTNIFTVPAFLAALSMTAAPLAAASMVPDAAVPVPVDATWNEAGETAHQHRRHGWGRGWNRHRHRDRVDAGDVIAGVLILGGIAAVVDAVKDSRDRRYRNGDRHRRSEDWRGREWRDAEWPPREREQRDYRTAEDRSYSAIDAAAATCTGEVEREARVDSIEAVQRSVAGWEVRGTLSDGAAFVCQVGADGRVTDVDYSLRRDRPVFDGDDDPVRD